MKKSLKKIIAMVCAIAMVVSSMTINTKINVRAEEEYNWKLIAVNADSSSYADTFYYDELSYTGFDVVDTIRQYESKPCLYLAAKTDLVDSITVNGNELVKKTDYFMAGAQLYLNMESMTQGINIVDVTYNSTTGFGAAKIIIKMDKEVVTTTASDQPSTPAQKINSDDNLVKTTSTVMASSEADPDVNTNFVVANAHDRNVNTRWAAGRVDNKTVSGEWIYVDLESTYKVTSVASVWDYLPTSGYQIYYATDLTGDTTTRGTVDTNVWTAATEAITNTTTSADGKEDVLSGIVARYIMIYALSGTPDWGISIKEIGVFGEEATLIDPVTNVQATGGTKTINVTFDLPVNVADGTQYYVYLDNNTVESAIVNTNNATLTGVSAGNHIVKVKAYYNEVFSTAAESATVKVYGEPTAVTNLQVSSMAANQVSVSWDNVEDTIYTVELLDAGTNVVGTKTVSDGTAECTFTEVEKGSYTVRVTASVNGQSATPVTSDALTVEDVQTDAITVYETEIEPVTIGGVQTLDSTWSYEFSSQSADAYIGLNDNGDLITYLPTYAGAAVDHVYELITGLEIGKTYTYTYRVDTLVAYNNIPVSVTAEGGYSDNYELTDITEDGVTVSRTFTATAETMKIDYTLGWLNNAASVKISKAVVEMLQPAEVSGLVATGGIQTIHLSWDSVDAPDSQTYNIYLDGSATPVVTDIQEKDYLLTDVAIGTHSVTVKAVLNGVETTGQTIANVEVTEMPDYITSDSVKVEGFQIKTNNPEDNVAFRTVCKAPNKGSSIVASDGNTYEIASMGTIYTLDENNDGYRRNDVLDPLYTILNPTAVSADITETMGYTYVGANSYNGTQRTYGYIATEDKGIAANWNTADKDNTYYVRTMDGMSANGAMEYTIHVRAFVIATDGTIIYGKKTASVSVAEVADYLYKNSKAQNYTGHQYLYNSILTKVSNTNPYYRTSILSYGWDSNLFVPSNPTFTINDGTLDDLNGNVNP